MSDENAGKRQRSPINALRVLNQLREQKGLSKATTKPKRVTISPELKKEITREELLRLFPEALSEEHYEFNAEQARKLVREVEFRLDRIKAGREPAPAVKSAGPKTKP